MILLRGVVVVLATTFSFVSHTLGQDFPPGFEPFLITLDHEDNFVFTGVGQTTTGIDFQGPSGAFRSAPGAVAEHDPEKGIVQGAAPAPFQFLLENKDSQVVMGMILGVDKETHPKINGSFPLGFGPTDLSVLDELFIQVGFEERAIENPLNYQCRICSYPNLQISPNGGLAVANVNELLINVTLISDDGITINQLPPGITVLDQSEGRMTLGNLEGFEPASLLDLDFVSASATQPVFAEFTLADETSFGPFLVAAAVPEPSSQCILLSMLSCIMLFRDRQRRVK